MTNLPVPFTYTTVSLSIRSTGTMDSITCSRTSFSICFNVTPSSCCAAITMLGMRRGTPCNIQLSPVICHPVASKDDFLFAALRRLKQSLWASEMGNGISSAGLITGESHHHTLVAGADCIEFINFLNARTPDLACFTHPESMSADCSLIRR